MPLMDDRGRLFGRLNVIDAFVGCLTLGLIGLGYGALLLFRTPMPTIAALEPATIDAGRPMMFRVTGTNLRPYLSVDLTDIHAAEPTPIHVPFAVETPTEATLRVPALTPGRYDLLLRDEGRGLLQQPNAITVIAPVLRTRDVRVQLIASPEAVNALTQGDTEAGDQPAALLSVSQTRIRFVATGTVQNYQIDRDVIRVDTWWRVTLEPNGEYRTHRVLVGAMISFATSRALVTGWIVEVREDAAP